MKNITQLFICVLLIACASLANARPDWLDVTVKLRPSKLQQKFSKVSEMQIPMDISIKNTSRMRAVMRLTNMNLTVTGQIFCRNHPELDWKNHVRYQTLPYLKNHVMRFKSRDVEIMPGEVYKRTLYIPAKWFSPELAKYSSLQVHPSSKQYYLDFDVESVVMDKPRSRKR